MKRTIILSLTSILSFGVTLSALAHEKTTTVLNTAKPKKMRTVDDYETQKIQGWTIHVEKTAKANPKYDAAIKLLDANLVEIIKIINPEIVTKLKEVPIWLNNDSRNGAEYHPSGKWLKDNGFMVEKAQCIELQSVSSFVAGQTLSRWSFYMSWHMPSIIGCISSINQRLQKHLIKQWHQRLTRR